MEQALPESPTPGTTPRRPRLSVVVPIYNVERYLDECLASITAQELSDFEVVMVDDGSTDGSADIARRWADADPRFRLVRQANHGLGHARNTGAEHATGEYLAFLDSDDKVPGKAYRLMVDTLADTGSDFATGNVHRFNSTGQWQAPLYRGLNQTRKLATHVTRDQELLRDHLAHNKVWRTSFWQEAGLSFPVGVLYEDVPAVIPAHYRAKAVDVVPVVAVLWREREPGDASITQGRATDQRQLRDRVAAVRSNSRFFAAQGAWELKGAYDILAVNRDLRFFVDVFDQVDDEYRHLIRELVGEFLAEVSPATIQKISAVNRLKYALLRAGATAELVELVKRVRAKETDDEPVVLEGDRAFLDLALRRDPRLGLPADTFDITDELRIASRVTDIRVTRHRIALDGWAYLDRIATGTCKDTEIQVWLESGGVRVPARVTRRTDPRAAESARPLMEGCEDSAFTAEVPVRKLWRWWRPRGRTWSVMVSVQHGAIQRTSPLSRPVDGEPERPVVTHLRSDWWLRMCWEESGGLTCRVRREGAVLSAVEAGNGGLSLTLALGSLVRGDSVLELRPESGTPSQFAIERTASGTGQVTVPADRLLAGASAPHREGPEVELSWAAFVRRAGGAPARRVLVPDHLPGGSVPAGPTGELATRRTRAANLSLLARPVAARLRVVRWEVPSLHVEIGYRSDRSVEAVVLSSLRQSEELVFPVIRNGDRLVAELGVTALPVFGDRLPIRAGTWGLQVRTDHGDVDVLVSGDMTGILPISIRHAGRDYTFTDRRWHRASLLVSSELPPVERGKANQRRLSTEVYRAAMAGRRNAILYESYFGKQFSDSPRRVFEELVRRAPDLEHLVVVRDQQVALPDGAVPVPNRSRLHHEALAQARYIVTNVHLPSHFERAPDQVVLQTWHGVGTKRIGLDIENVQFANVGYQAKLAREVASWDYLISPNPFTSPILRRAFGYEGPLLETGAPRNDLFHRPDRDEAAATTRKRLGIDPARQIVLYAPTWRDSLFTAAGRYRLDLRFDLARAAQALGDDYVILFRKHSNVIDKLPTRMLRGVIDASDYPDVQDLLLVADVLVSDYSTLMCDFANTGRPMLFYTYDLDHYRDQLRGFYFDFEAEVPGPLITEEADLVPAILDATAIRAKYDAQYRAFADRFCAWDDGRATARVLDAVFGDLGSADAIEDRR
jgi:CDP-glycerol glycerophosphotransferase